MENNANIQEFYNLTRMEETRLDEDVSMLEKVRSQEIIDRYLHGTMTIADIGGATGAYSFWLHDKGHEVHLLDASSGNIELAKKKAAEQNKPLASIEQGDARSLPYKDASFDMVLLMGPLYHLHNAGERIQAIKEAHRILKEGGVIIAASITRYASLLDGFWRNFASDPVFENIMKEDLATGRHINPTSNPHYFTTAFFHTQQELEQEFSSIFTSPMVMAVEGFGWLLPNFMQQWNEAASRERMLQYIRQMETDPVFIGMSAHQLTIAKKAKERRTDVKF